MTPPTDVIACAHGFTTAVRVVPRRGDGDDRAIVVASEDRIIIALADGAGGIGGGARAADATIAAVVAADAGASWTELLDRVDRSLPRIGPGLTTAVIVDASPRGMHGASVGDSIAWVIGDEVVELTAQQRQKPLLGDGAVPVAFAHSPLAPGATLLVASDGLWRYARRAAVIAALRGDDLETAADTLVELVRLPTGGLPDDLSLVVCRRAPEQSQR